jgi:septum site-determining protein MinC
MRQAKKNQLIEFKGNTLSVIVVTLCSLQPEALAKAAAERFGDDAFFDGDAALLELSQVDHGGDHGAVDTDWTALRSIFQHHGLHIIGVRGANEALRQSAMRAGLADFPAQERAARTEPAPPSATPEVANSTPKPASELTLPTAGSPTAPIRIIDRPLRSGQQIYARGGDLVVLAAVSSGAEVIADGSIHIYAPLRGRALAGANGAVDARIFTTRFEAELVSIAGVYRTFESGVPPNLAGQPVQIQFAKGIGETNGTLNIVPLKIN